MTRCAYCWSLDEDCITVIRHSQPSDYLRKRGKLCHACVVELSRSNEIAKGLHSQTWEFVVDFTGQAQF